MERKEFQQSVIDTFDAFVERLVQQRDVARKVEQANLSEVDPDLMRPIPDWPGKAWNALREARLIANRNYQPRKDGAGRHVPSICFKVPTGGGKTYLAADCAARLINNLEGRNTGLVLWIVPSDSIYSQTLGHLNNRAHPYRQLLDRAAAGSGNVRIIEKDSPLHAKDLEANLCVMVLMLQAARRADKSTLRFFRDRGDVHGFVPPADDLPAHEALLALHPNLDQISTLIEDGIGYQGRVSRTSLGNALRICRPVVIMDEGHYAYTPLAMETIYGLNPSFVLELSATPNAEANVLVDVPGTALEQEEMIKIPINLTVDEASLDWRDTLRKAWDQTCQLQAEADRLDADQGRYIRPILLVQVERTGKDQREGGYIHAKDAREFLQSLGVDDSQIAEKTAEVDELKEYPYEVLRSRECPIRVIITKQALQEGWDCPFAYVLCSLAASKNLRSLTQLVGRILRQPEAKKTGRQTLDECYVFCHHATTGEIVDSIKKSLMNEGMGDLVGRVKTTTLNVRTTDRLPRRDKFATLSVYFPKVLWTDGDAVRDLDYEQDILAHIDWDSVELGDLIVEAGEPRRTRFVRVDLSILSSPQTTSVEASEWQPLDPAYITRAILDYVPNPWIARRLIGDLIEGLREQGRDDEWLGRHGSDILSTVRRWLEVKQTELAEALFRTHLATGRIRFQLRTDRHAWRLPDALAVSLGEAPRHLLRSDGSPIENSVFQVFEHDLNNLEQGVARYLDVNASVTWWHRNVARGQGYGLQGWKRHRVYPDILIGVSRADGDRRLIALETKGGHLGGSEDTEYKRRLLELLTETAADVPSASAVGTLNIEMPDDESVVCDLVLDDQWRDQLARLLGDSQPPSTTERLPDDVLWVAASDLRNYCEGEPLLDWFRHFGEGAGFVPDTARADYRPETDMSVFVRAKGREFESKVVDLIRARLTVADGSLPEDDGDWEIGFARTLQLMHDGVDVIYQGVVASQEHKLWGKPDLLIRSDQLVRLFDEAPHVVDAGAFGHAFHYVPIDIKFKSFNLLKSGELGASEISKRAQVAVYALALGEMQGHRPAFGYLLGRCVNLYGEKGESRSCFDRLAPVSVDPLLGTLEDAATWFRRLLVNGGSWSPRASTSLEMQLNMSNTADAPWHHAKKELAAELRPLSGLWQVSLARAETAISRGVRSWSPDLAIEDFGLSPQRADTLRQILAAQRPGFECTAPEAVQLGREVWGEPQAVEFYVDFETVTDLDDDFSQLPLKGGSPRIFMIGCGHVEDGEWVFRDFTANDLGDAEEQRVVRQWLEHMEATRQRLAPEVERPLVFHWSHAEVSFLSSAYNSAVARLGGTWPEIRWYDLLSEVIRPTPFVVHGALGFGLKAVAKSLHALGKIDTKWEEGPVDGLAAMVSAWHCAAESAATGAPMSEHPLMREILAYNEVDCRVMMEIVDLLRCG
jgi:type III restriction enzyme